ncbi:hypothetical protein MBRA1_003915 [Malassezia brasiliensis]|uniref:ATPase inhibitor, mitochondrial n=1 Tax=Malassezia brasiliensis TaxID=1821822 RepID=A0AAF0DXL7_9BASI|nr:hypothetical protein MBRA1_003915 [Malassezia brasiliensis]
MLTTRLATQLPVRSAVSRAAGAVRAYSNGDGSAGATGHDPGWKSREQALEGSYILEQEKAKLKKLHESIERQKKVVENLESGQKAEKK